MYYVGNSRTPIPSHPKLRYIENAIALFFPLFEANVMEAVESLLFLLRNSEGELSFENMSPVRPIRSSKLLSPGKSPKF
jgi:hypothetical protein